MKKWTFLFLGLLVIGSGVSALDMAVGGGVLYNYSNTIGDFTLDYGYGSESYALDITRNGFGGFAFFGFSQYAELNLGFLYKNADLAIDGSHEGTLDPTTAIQLGLYGKYPIPLSDRFVFFPTVGVDFEFTMETQGYDTDVRWGWWHDLWLRGGVGLDFFLGERLFIRSHLIYGAALPLGEAAAELGLKLTHGFLFKAGIGFML